MCFELTCFNLHAEEEKLSIKEELTIVTRYLHQQSQAIRESIQTLSMSDSNRFAKGKIMSLYTFHQNLEELFQSFVRCQLASNTDAIPFIVHEELNSKISHDSENDTEIVTHILMEMTDSEMFNEEVNEEDIDDDDFLGVEEND